MAESVISAALVTLHASIPSAAVKPNRLGTKDARDAILLTFCSLRDANVVQNEGSVRLYIPRAGTGDNTVNMMKTPMLYGIPNCDTVRKARKWLDSHHVAHDFVDLREATPSRERLTEWLNIAGSERLINRRSTTFKQLSDAERSALDQGGAVDVLLAYPTLIKRPVLEWRDTVSVGFTTDDYAHYFGL